MKKNSNKANKNYLKFIFFFNETSDIEKFFSGKYSSKKLLLDLYKKNEDEGFTFLEIILIAMVFGTISSIAVPRIDPIVNKFRQKEATGIVNSMIKASQSNYALFAQIPDDLGDLSKFATFQKCNEQNVDVKGSSVCRTSIPVNVRKEVLFYSPSGRYKVEMRKGYTSDGTEIFQVNKNQLSVKHL